MDNEARPATQPDRYTWPKRALLLVLGGAAAVVGAGLAVLFVGLFVDAARHDRLTGRKLVEAGLVAFAAALVFGGFAALGVGRAMSGVRGRPSARRPQASRAESWLLENWYLAGLLVCAAWTGWSLASSDGLKAFLLGPTHPGRMAWYALLAHVVLPAHVAIHELGHAAAGALVGFRFRSLRVGWLSVHREGGRYRVAWERPAFADVLGFHGGVPIGPGSLGGRIAARAAAGPVVSLLAALACRAGAEALGPPADAGQAVAFHALRVAWWVGVGLGVGNLLPFRTTTGTMSDGAIVLRGLRPGSPAADAVLRFHALWAEGKRPREWGIAATGLLQAAEGANSQRDTLLLAALAVALDTGDEALAADVLGRALASPTSPEPSMRYELELQAVMVDAFQGQSGAARERLVRLGPPRKVLPEYPRLAEAVVDAAEGRLAEAGAALEAWERALAATGEAASILVGNQWVVEKLRARLAAERR